MVRRASETLGEAVVRTRRREANVMTMTARGLNRATLARQILRARRLVAVPDPARRVVGLPAQQPGAPHRAGEPDPRFRPERTHCGVRGPATRHGDPDAVPLAGRAARGLPAKHEATQPSLRSWLGHRYFTQCGLSADDAEALLPAVLAHTSTPRINSEVERWIARRIGIGASGVWLALRMFGPFLHAPTGGIALGPGRQSERRLPSGHDCAAATS